MDSTTPPSNSAANPFGMTTTTGASGKQYTVPQVVLDKYPALVDLIKKTESMSDDERNYWFQILPIMTEEQVNRLKGILEQEAQQLAKLDDQYQGQLAELNKKHLEEWNAFQHKQDRVALQKAEAADQAKEAQTEEQLLQKLSQADAGNGTAPAA